MDFSNPEQQHLTKLALSGALPSQDVDFSRNKTYATSKYQKRLRQKQKEVKNKEVSLDSQYEDLVSDIRKLRLRKKKRDKVELEKKLKKLETVKKSQRKIKAIAMASTKEEFVQQFGVPLLDLLRSMIDSAKSAREYVGEELLKFLLDLFTTLYNVYKNPKWDGVLINFSSFFMRNFDSKHSDLALEWFKQAFEVVWSQSDGEDIDRSYTEYILEFFKMSDSFLNDMLWQKISDFFSKIVTLYAAGKEMISVETLDFTTLCAKFTEFRKSLPKITDVVEMAFQAYTFITGNWEQVRSGDWSKILLGRDETKVFELEIRELEQAYSFVLAGQEIELKNIYSMTPEQYENRLKKAVDKAKQLIIRATNVQQRMSVSNFIRKLTDMQANLWARKADAPTKAEAYAIKMSGPSSCGKSTMIKLMSKTILNAYGQNPNEGGNVVFTNLDERYESTILPSHKIIVADDVANNKNSKPNYDRLLNYVNTVPRPLEKASAEEKGKYYPGNAALIATTNDETLRAMECSVCPESILRRFAIDIEVSIRPEFRNEYGGLKKQDTLRFDVYSLVLKRFEYIEPHGEKPIIHWDVIPRNEWNPFQDDDHDFHAMCSFISKDIARHNKRQQSQAVIQKQLDECGFCGVCGCPDIICSCLSEDSESTSDQQVEEEMPIAMAGIGDYWQGLSTRELWDLRIALSSLGNVTKNTARLSMKYTKLYQDRAFYMKCATVMILSGIFSVVLGKNFTSLLSLSTLGYAIRTYKRTLAAIETELDRRQDQLSSLCEDVTTHLETNSRKYFKISGGIFLAYTLYKVLRPLLKKRSAQDTSTYFEPVRTWFDNNLDMPAKGQYAFDIQDRRDYKEGYSRLPPKSTHDSKTTTSRDLQISLARSLRHVITKSRGATYSTVNGIMVASNVLMLPAHAVPYTFPFDIETSSTPGVPSAKTKDQALTPEFCWIDRDHDQAYVHLASSPASTDYAKFFPEEYPSFYGKSTVLLWKSPDGEVKISRQAVRPNPEPVKYQGYLEHEGLLWGERKKLTTLEISAGEGLVYDTEFKGFGGLCGGLIVDADKGIIYGFHVAGLQNSFRGWSTGVLQSHIKTALAELKLSSPTLVVHSAGDIQVNKYDQPYSLVNQKPLYTREDGTQNETVVSYIGTVHKEGAPLESRARTPYIPTPFKGVAENLGERKHKPPKKPNDVARGMKTLNKLTNPVQHYEGNILKRAVDDFQRQTLRAISSDPEAHTILRMYTQEEALDGIGAFGLGGMPNDTSAGFPINKSKKSCLVRDPMDESLPKIPREFNDNYDIQSEIDYTMNCWRNGQRSEPIFKASSKVNELLPDAKADEKPRKFYGSPMANFVASRQVLAGVPRIMRKHWKEMECLVGINPLSTEWGQFHDHLTEYSTTNMIAGDFSGFDTRMAAQITGAAAKIITSWYEHFECTEEEMALLEGALSDIIHPNILFDGDLYRFANGNPSGNMITVQLNSICNSIMMRYVYYAQMPTITEDFWRNVRLGTFGDDNAMSVKHHCSWFTHTSCQEEFKRLGIGYTMADKNAASRPYIDITEVSFLKRGFVVHPELNSVVGPIEEDSILKRFHWIKKPTETPLNFEEQFGAYTDGAFREKYLYGRKVYDEFSANINNIVKENPSLKGVVQFIPYDEMTVILRPDYSSDYVNKNEKLFAESFGVSMDELYYSELEADDKRK